jgi:hypothetical protein
MPFPLACCGALLLRKAAASGTMGARSSIAVYNRSSLIALNHLRLDRSTPTYAFSLYLHSIDVAITTLSLMTSGPKVDVSAKEGSIGRGGQSSSSPTGASSARPERGLDRSAADNGIRSSIF